MSDTVEASINADTLDTALDILQSLVDESRFHLSPDGLTAAVVDPANVAMHKPLELHAGAFDSAPSGEATIGVNLERLQDYISKANSDQSVALSVDLETGTMEIAYAKYSTSMALIDPDAIRKDPDTSQVELQNEFVVEASDLQDAIDYADLASDHVAIKADPDNGEVQITAEGDTDDTTVTLDGDDLIGGSLDAESEALFSLDYFTSVVDDIPGGEVRVLTDQEYPAKLFYEFADGNASVETMIAPRIST